MITATPLAGQAAATAAPDPTPIRRISDATAPPSGYVLGWLRGPLTYFADDRELNPGVEVAHARIMLDCWICGVTTDTCGWKLNGRLRCEGRILHCCGAHVWIRPFASRKGHHFDPGIRIERPSRRLQSEDWPSRPANMKLFAWCSWKSRLIEAARIANPHVDEWAVRRVAAAMARAAFAAAGD